MVMIRGPLRPGNVPRWQRSTGCHHRARLDGVQTDFAFPRARCGSISPGKMSVFLRFLNESSIPRNPLDRNRKSSKYQKMQAPRLSALPCCGHHEGSRSRTPERKSAYRAKRARFPPPAWPKDKIFGKTILPDVPNGPKKISSFSGSGQFLVENVPSLAQWQPPAQDFL